MPNRLIGVRVANALFGRQLRCRVVVLRTGILRKLRMTGIGQSNVDALLSNAKNDGMLGATVWR